MGQPPCLSMQTLTYGAVLEPKAALGSLGALGSLRARSLRDKMKQHARGLDGFWEVGGWGSSGEINAKKETHFERRVGGRRSLGAAHERDARQRLTTIT